MKNVKQYYKEIGKLVYSIAIADGIVQPEEQEKLHQFVLKELAHHEKTYDSSGMNQAFYVDFEFDELVEKHGELNATLKHFNQFLENNLEQGDDALIDRSLKLLESVANAYSKEKEKNIVEQVKHITSLQLKK